MRQPSVWWQAVQKNMRRGMQAYSQFMEKQGFYLVLGICVLVIVGTAFWTRSSRTAEPPPPQESGQQANVPYEGVEQLSDMTPAVRSTATPAPVRQTNPTFTRPVSGALLREFDRTRPVYFALSRTWQVHSACDYQADTGAVVAAAASGTVISVKEDAFWGKTVTIDHGAGWVSIYGAMSASSYVKAGDPVQKGQTIGHVGNSSILEEDLGPHLHFAFLKDGQPINPETVWEGEQ